MTGESDLPSSAPLPLRIAESWPVEVWQNLTVLLGVSGGPDSVALLRAIHALRPSGPGRVIVAHFNHRLRGAESDADERFVAETAFRLGYCFDCGHGPPDGIQSAGGDGFEASARRARYRYLARAAGRFGARYVAVAHTADDQVETILHRILRGTGVKGLAGMPRARPLTSATTLIRPLLGFRREDLRCYLDDLGQSYRNDTSNSDCDRTRNRIRHELLPELATRYNPYVVDAILRLGTVAGEMQTLIDAMVEQLAARAVQSGAEHEIRIDLRRLEGESSYLTRELFAWIWRDRGWPLRDMGFQQWDLLARLASSSATPGPAKPLREMLPGGVSVDIQEGALHLARHHP
jgi:tRNA(Ile)-lysidine synthase